MKKKILSVLLASIVLFGNSQFVEAQTQVLNLDDTLEIEEIEKQYSNYKETDEQVSIYLFRGEGCSHCRDFLEYLNSIAEENGYLFKLRSFEVYNNEDNLKTKNKIAQFFGDSASGVPYIVIGKDTFYGFGKKDGDKILSSIKKEYASKTKYDVFDKMEYKNDKKTSPYLTVGLASIIILVPIIIVLIKRHQNGITI